MNSATVPRLKQSSPENILRELRKHCFRISLSLEAVYAFTTYYSGRRDSVSHFTNTLHLATSVLLQFFKTKFSLFYSFDRLETIFVYLMSYLFITFTELTSGKIVKKIFTSVWETD